MEATVVKKNLSMGMKRALRCIAQHDPVAVHSVELLRRYGTGIATLRSLKERGLVEVFVCEASETSGDGWERDNGTWRLTETGRAEAKRLVSDFRVQRGLPAKSS